MKLSIEQLPDGEETQVIVRCHEVDEQVTKLINFIQSDPKKLIGFEDSTVLLINPDDVYYIESVDNHVFIYLHDRVCESRQKLYEIESEFTDGLIFRASKSVILNIGKIVSIRPLFDGRFEARLLNGEKAIISRQYVPVLKRKLGI